MASKYEAYGGQVIFTCSHGTLESFIVRDAMDEAVPEQAEFKDGSNLQIIWNNFRLLFSNTSDIEFHLSKTADDDLRDLQTFWKQARNNTDYAALWLAFRKLITDDVSQTWADAVGNAIPARLLAPKELQPDAPEDEALDPNALRPETAT